MKVVVMDEVMKMRRVIGLQSLIHRFLSAPPQRSGSLQSLEKQKELSKTEKSFGHKNQRSQSKLKEMSLFKNILQFRRKFCTTNTQNVLVIKKTVNIFISQTH